MQETEKLYAREEAGRQALGLVGRVETSGFTEAFDDFKKVYEFLKEEFEASFEASIEKGNNVLIARFLREAGYPDITPSDVEEALSTSGVADPLDELREPNV